LSYPFRSAVLDTSVAVKWFIQEEDSEKAADLRHAHGRGELLLYAPDILLMELTNALRYSPAVSAGEIPEALRLFPGLEIPVIPFDPEALISCITLSLENDLAIYDAYFLALAQALEMPLITADRKMLSHLTPEDGALSLDAL
jgi:predicted nucleic acid-binding protein